MANASLKIAQVIARLNIGGPAVAVVSASHGLSLKGHNIALLTGDVPQGEASMEYLAEDSGLRLTRIAGMSRQISWWKDLVSFWHLLRIFRSERPDVVHTHTAKAGVLGRLAAILSRVPVRVHTFHGHVFSGYFPPLISHLIVVVERWLAYHSDCIIAISESQRRELGDEFRIAPAHKIVTIPLGCDLHPFLSSNRRQDVAGPSRVSPREHQVGWIGRLTRIKDPQLFLKSVDSVRGHHETRYLMIGDGELRAACDQMISAQEIENRVSIVGWQRHLEQWYAKLDLIVLTSINEGTPVVLIEAMASGRPFVAVDVGGVRDLMVGDAGRVNQLEVFRNGILVPRDPKSIAQAITYLLEDENRRLDMGNTGREFVRERFSKQRMTQDLESLYSRVLRSKFETHRFSETSKPSESPLQS